MRKGGAMTIRRWPPLLLTLALLLAACGEAEQVASDVNQRGEFVATPTASTASPTAVATMQASVTTTSPTRTPESPTEEPGDATGFAFIPGTPWQGQGTQGISQQEVEAFNDYPVFWLGKEAGGYHLQDILRDTFTPRIGFVYGTCTEFPCVSPIDI